LFIVKIKGQLYVNSKVCFYYHFIRKYNREDASTRKKKRKRKEKEEENEDS